MLETATTFELLSDSITIERIATCLIHFLWQGAIIGLLAVAATRLMASASSQARYSTYVTLMALMVCCIPSTYIAVASVASSRTAYDAPIVSTFESKETIPAVRAEQRSRALPTAPMDQPTVSARTIHAAPLPKEKVAPSRPLSFGKWRDAASSSYAPLFVKAWAAGVILMLLRLTLATFAGLHLRMTSKTISDPMIDKVVCEQARLIGTKRTPRAALSTRISVPVVVGVLYPLILLPPALATGLSPAQFRAVIAHELAHIRRFDPLIQFLQRLVEAFFFFHPAIWYLSRRMSAERENCCDDVVVASGTAPIGYADAIVRVAELFIQSSRPADGLAFLGSRQSDVTRRIHRLLVPEKKPTAGIGWLFIVAAMIVATVAGNSRFVPELIADEPLKSVDYSKLGNFSDDLIAVLGEDRARVTGMPLHLEVTNDGKRIFLTESHGYVAAYDAESLYRVQRFQAHKKRCLSVTLVHGTSLIVTTSLDGTARLWNTEGTPQLVDEYRLINENAEMTWLHSSRSRNGRRIAIRSDNGLELIDIKNDDLHLRAKLPTRAKYPPFQFALTPDGRYLVTCENLRTSTHIERKAEGGRHSYRDARLVVWDVGDAKPKITSTVDRKTVEKLTVQSDASGSIILCANDPYFLEEPKSHTWKLKDGQLVEHVESSEISHGIAKTTTSPDRRFRARPVGEDELHVSQWSDEAWQPNSKLNTGRLLSVAFVGDRSIVAATRTYLQRWDYENGKFAQRTAPHGHLGHVHSLVFEPSSNTLVSASGDSTRRWPLSKLSMDAPNRSVDIFKSDVTDLSDIAQWRDAASFILERSTVEGKTLTGIRRDRSDSYAPLFTIEFGNDYQKHVRSWDVHPTAEVLATGQRDGTIRLWDISQENGVQASPRQLAAIKESGHVTDVKFSPAGDELVATLWSGKVRAWTVLLTPNDQLEEAKLVSLPILGDHATNARCAEFSSDGHWLASGGDDGQILLWDVEDGITDTPPLPRSLMHEGEFPQAQSMEGISVGTLDFSPDGALVSGDGRGRVTIWSVETGKPKKTWQLPGWIWKVAVSPDGKMIATGNGDGTVYMLRIPE